MSHDWTFNHHRGFPHAAVDGVEVNSDSFFYHASPLRNPKWVAAVPVGEGLTLEVPATDAGAEALVIMAAAALRPYLDDALKADLRLWCRGLHLSDSGTKADLAARIRAAAGV